MSGGVQSEAEIDGRADLRTNMFIAAAMYAEGISSPVRVRNMSASGALIEAAVSPPVGTGMRLSRGTLLVSGRVIWSAGSRCGVRFDSLITVRNWLAPPANAGQAQVDAMVAQVKAGMPQSSLPVHSHPVSQTASKGLRAALVEVSALIGQIGDALADDLATVARHGTELQKIDKALQLLAAVQDRPN